jgi:hypothetical protein
VQQLHTGVSFVPRQILDAQRRAVGASRLEPVGLLPYVGSGESAGVRRLSCYEPLVPRSWASLDRKLKGKPHRADTLFSLDPQHHPTIYDVASVERVLLPRLGGRVKIFVNDDALPRAFALEDHRVADREAALEHVARGDVDFRQLVLLDRDPGLPPARSGGGLYPARIAEDRPERVAIEVDVPRPALLVLTDTHYPGWQARVDGEPAEIYLANGLHRALRVTAGPHRVVFEYRPASFRLGAALSLASLAALAVVSAFQLRRRRGLPATAASR